MSNTRHTRRRRIASRPWPLARRPHYRTDITRLGLAEDRASLGKPEPGGLPAGWTFPQRPQPKRRPTASAPMSPERRVYLYRRGNAITSHLTPAQLRRLVKKANHANAVAQRAAGAS